MGFFLMQRMRLIMTHLACFLRILCPDLNSIHESSFITHFVRLDLIDELLIRDAF